MGHAVVQRLEFVENRLECATFVVRGQAANVFEQETFRPMLIQ